MEFGVLRRNLKTEVREETKMKFHKTAALQTLLYGIESWRVKATDINRIQSELLSFQTFSIVWYPRDQRTQRFGNWICFYPQMSREDTYSVGSLRKS
jgi:hypothetical protein